MGSNRGITLIALVITIIVLIILAAVTINMLFGDNGIITNAQLASFATEIKTIEENVDQKKINKEIKKYLYNESEKIFEENVVTTLKMSDTLKQEIMYYRDDDAQNKKTSDYNPLDFESYITIDSENKIENLYIIDKETAGGKEDTYIYDEKTNVVFKIKQTKIGGKIYHTYKSVAINQGDSVPSDIIEDEFESYKLGYYEPDFKGFDIQNTYIVYYSNEIANTNENITKELVPIKEYIENGRNNIIEKDGKTYIAYDYNQKIWANAVTKANGVESWWVWIPRYSYSSTLTNNKYDILFTTLENKVVLSDNNENVLLKDLNSEYPGYISHSAFTIEDTINDKTIELKGIWMSKFNASYAESGASTSQSKQICYAPDMEGFDNNNTYMVYYSSDFNNKYEMKLSDYIVSGSPRTKEISGETYTLYDYNKKIWANIVTKANGVESWWVWVPRYAYSTNIQTGEFSIIFIDTDNRPIDTSIYGTKLPETYILHDAFTVEGRELKGIWMSKFNASYAESGASTSQSKQICYAPDMEGFDNNNTYMVYYSSDFNNKYEMKLSDYIASGSPRTKEISGETYTLYDYNKKIWANIVTKANDIESWWVWIPRYAYSTNIQTGEFSIIFIDINNKPIDTSICGDKLSDTYIVHSAFTVDNIELKGIWMSKFNATYVDETTTDSSGNKIVASTSSNSFTNTVADGHAHNTLGYGSKERYVSSSDHWCDAYVAGGTKCTDKGFYRYCSLCGARLKYYWCKQHFDPNKYGRVQIYDDDIE